jgi:hypothetical protein
MTITMADIFKFIDTPLYVSVGQVYRSKGDGKLYLLALVGDGGIVNLISINSAKALRYPTKVKNPESICEAEAKTILSDPECFTYEGESRNLCMKD